MRTMFIILLLLWTMSVLSAQESSAPMLYVQDGYIFSWTNSEGTQQLTTEAFASDLALSPDGSTFVFIQQARDYPGTAGFETGTPLQTSHICLWNDGSPDCITEDSEIVILRRYLQWQDDNHLTWIEYPLAEEEEQRDTGLILYDLETGEHYQLNNLPLLTGDAGNLGFYSYAVFRDQLYVSCCSGSPSIRLYNRQTGTQEFQTYVPETIYFPEAISSDVRFAALLPVQGDTQDEMVILYCDGQWQQMDLENSVWDNAIHSSPENPPYFGLLTEAAGVLRVRLSSHLCDSSSQERVVWEIVAGDGSVLGTLAFPFFNGSQFQFSPDGQQVAYLTEDGIHIWRDGEFQLIEDTEGATEFVWGIVGWVLPAAA